MIPVGEVRHKRLQPQQDLHAAVSRLSPVTFHFNGELIRIVVMSFPEECTTDLPHLCKHRGLELTVIASTLYVFGIDPKLSCHRPLSMATSWPEVFAQLPTCSNFRAPRAFSAAPKRP